MREGTDRVSTVSSTYKFTASSKFSPFDLNKCYFKMDNQLLKRLIKSRKNVKQKYRTLKADIVKSQSNLEKTYNPITRPLQQLISTMKAVKVEPIPPSPTSAKMEPFMYKSWEGIPTTPKRQKIRKTKQSTELPSPIMPSSSSSLVPIRSKLPAAPLAPEQVYETYVGGGDSDDDELDSPTRHFIDESLREFSDLTKDENPLFQRFLMQFDPLPRIYVKESIRDTQNQFDHRFGVYHDLESNTFSIGDSSLQFDGPDILIKGVRYKGTPGLYELLFKNHPTAYKKEDEKEYFEILKQTNCLHEKHDSSQPLKRVTKDVKEKYKAVIEPRRLRPRSGSLPHIQTRSATRKVVGGNISFLKYNKNPIEYKYYDDFNEIVERLKLLLASQAAGNGSHSNEIINLIEELREAGIIK